MHVTLCAMSSLSDAGQQQIWDIWSLHRLHYTALHYSSTIVNLDFKSYSFVLHNKRTIKVRNAETPWKCAKKMNNGTGSSKWGREDGWMEQ